VLNIRKEKRFHYIMNEGSSLSVLKQTGEPAIAAGGLRGTSSRSGA